MKNNGDYTGIQDQHPEWVEAERQPQVAYRRVPDLNSCEQ